MTAKKDPAAKSIAVNVTFPPTLRAKVKALARDRRLSEVCREAVERAEI